ncbi:MAG TPA: cupin domain-containing protein [Candidatus Limnocylindrales bacterium]|jgi:quercetin dioxygenase-like cupin family protein
MRKRLLLAIGVAAIAALAFGGIVLATPATLLTTIPITSGHMAPVNFNVKTGDWQMGLRTKGESDVIVTESILAPGGSFGWHSHPGPSLVVVKSGTLSFYRGDDPTCTVKTYVAGDVFIDPGNVVHLGRNEGTVDLDIITTRLVPTGAVTRIDEPAPGNCGF